VAMRWMPVFRSTPRSCPKTRLLLGMIAEGMDDFVAGFEMLQFHRATERVGDFGASSLIVYGFMHRLEYFVDRRGDRGTSGISGATSSTCENARSASRRRTRSSVRLATVGS